MLKNANAGRSIMGTAQQFSTFSPKRTGKIFMGHTATEALTESPPPSGSAINDAVAHKQSIPPAEEPAPKPARTHFDARTITKPPHRMAPAHSVR